MTTATAVESPFESLERLTPLIREHANQSEAQATLARPVADALRDAGMFRQLTPASLGGGEIGAVDWYRLVEAGARIDGSVGWCMFINGATGLGGRTMPEAQAEKLFGDPRTIAAGTVFPFGKAVAVDGGYRVTGRWAFASGCKHATHLIAFCTVWDGETQRQSPLGMPDMRIVMAPVGAARILETWDVVGLAGTGSHDVVWDEVFVPETESTSLMPQQPNRFYTGPLYRLPFFTLFGWPMGGVALGIAQHAIDLVSELARTKVPAGMVAAPLNARPLFHLQLAEATALVRSARAWLHEAVGNLVAIADAGGSADLQSRINLQLAASNATKSARAATEVMFLAGGGTSIYRKNDLQRCMRDILALSQHAATSPATWEAGGAILAGQAPANPLILL